MQMNARGMSDKDIKEGNRETSATEPRKQIRPSDFTSLNVRLVIVEWYSTKIFASHYCDSLLAMLRDVLSMV